MSFPYSNPMSHFLWCRGSVVRGILILTGVLASLSVHAAAQAQGLGNLTVTPTRVVFEGRDRSAVISLVNSGIDTALYRISVINMRMSESGQFERIDGDERLPGERFADELFRYAPRQVELAPGGNQNIRLLLRKPAGLTEGEYRSHLLIQAIPRKGAGQSVESTTNGEGVSIDLLVIPGVSLPVIVRHGTLAATGRISDMNLLPRSRPDDAPRLGFRINRSGGRSLFGDLIARYFAPGSDEGYVVSRTNQLAVYTPNATRSVVMRLTLPQGIELSPGGRIEVTYRTPSPEGAERIAAGAMTLR